MQSWLVGAALVLAAACEPPDSPDARRATEDSSIRFVDVTDDAGLTRATQTYDAALGDYDGDGLTDLFMGNHAGEAALMWNRADGTFEDVTFEVGIGLEGDKHGAGAADYDNDGDLDLLVSVGAGRGTVEKANRLYRNEGERGFVEVARSSGVADPHGRARSVAWLDVNRDGGLDLLLGNYASPIRLFVNEDATHFRDASEEYGLTGEAVRIAWTDVDRDGDPDLLLSGPSLRLLRNDDGARFVDVTAAAGLAEIDAPIGSMSFGDFDGDGAPDLYLGYGAEFDDGVVQAGDETRFAFFAGSSPRGLDFTLEGDLDLELLHNGSPVDLARIRCGETQLTADSAAKCPSDMAVLKATPSSAAEGYVVWRDLQTQTPCAGCVPRARWHLRWHGEGDHHLSGAVRRGSDPEPVELRPLARRGGSLWRNRGDGTFERLESADLFQDTNSQAAAWGDFDNDGALDLYVVDAGRDGAGGRNVLYRNAGGARFTPAPVDSGAGPDSGEGRGAAAHFIDFDRDGRLDLFLLNGWGAPPFDRGPYRLLRNRSAAGHWIGVDLVGKKSNRQGLGAWITVEACGKTQRRYHDGPMGPYSQSSTPLHFGLGGCTRASRVVVDWPSGGKDVLTDVEADRMHRIEETA